MMHCDKLIPMTNTCGRWLGLASLGLWLGLATGQGQVVLNEFMAKNETTIANEGTYPDWVELYNTSASPVDISGWALTDDPARPTRFIFPAGTLVSGNGYLLVWCDSLVTAPGLHTGFGLSQNGQTFLALYNQFQFVVDQVVFGIQITDKSCGRVPDGTGAWLLNAPTPESSNVAQTLAPFTSLKLNEWLATNSAGPDDDWLEIYNPETNPVALAGLVIADTNNIAGQAKYVAFTNLTFIDGDSFLAFTCDSKRPPSQANWDHLNFRISHSAGSQLAIFYPDRTTIIDQISFGPGVLYRDASMGRLPDGNPGTSYVIFPPGKTTKGASNFLPLTNVVINEVIAHTDPPFEDAIEVWNTNTVPVDISYFWISNQKNNPKKFRVPPGTVIPAGGYKVFYEMQYASNGFNTNGTGVFPCFTLNSARGDEVYIFGASNDAAGTLLGTRRGIDFGATENGVSLGRHITSTGDPDIVPMVRRTFGRDNPVSVFDWRQGTGLPNAYPLVGPVVITEIMYHPPDIGTNDNSLDEYLELYNMTTSPVKMYDTNLYADAWTNRWKVADAVKLTFPTNFTLGAGEFVLLVNFDPVTNTAQMAAFRSLHGIPPTFTNIFGPYGDKLKNSDASVVLYKPDPRQQPPHPDAGFVPQVMVERVHYRDSAPWPTEPDGSGAALQRVWPEGYGNDPTNWVAAAPSPGRQHIAIESFQHSGNNLTLRWTGWAGSGYTVQYCEALPAGVWQRATDVEPQAASGPRQAIVSVQGSGSRFYRVVSPKQP